MSAVLRSISGAVGQLPFLFVLLSVFGRLCSVLNTGGSVRAEGHRGFDQ